jgi:hypothetical protein
VGSCSVNSLCLWLISTGLLFALKGTYDPPEQSGESETKAEDTQRHLKDRFATSAFEVISYHHHSDANCQERDKDDEFFQAESHPRIVTNQPGIFTRVLSAYKNEPQFGNEAHGIQL